MFYDTLRITASHSRHLWHSHRIASITAITEPNNRVLACVRVVCSACDPQLALRYSTYKATRARGGLRNNAARLDLYFTFLVLGSGAPLAKPVQWYKLWHINTGQIKALEQTPESHLWMPGPLDEVVPLRLAAVLPKH